jgi:hypothetical protein
MTTRGSPLTKELLALYLKYGATEFEVAARELRSGDFAQLIAQAADSVGAAIHGSKPNAGSSRLGERAPTARRSKQDMLIDYVDGLMKTGDDKDAAVAKFAEQILSRQVLATSHTLQDYMDMIGMRAGVKTTDRYQHIKRIAEFLRALPKDEVIEKIRSAENLGEGGSALQRWTDIIVRSEGR